MANVDPPTEAELATLELVRAVERAERKVDEAREKMQTCQLELVEAQRALQRRRDRLAKVLPMMVQERRR